MFNKAMLLLVFLGSNIIYAVPKQPSNAKETLTKQLADLKEDKARREALNSDSEKTLQDFDNEADKRRATLEKLKDIAEKIDTVTDEQFKVDSIKTILHLEKIYDLSKESLTLKQRVEQISEALAKRLANDEKTRSFFARILASGVKRVADIDQSIKQTENALFELDKPPTTPAGAAVGVGKLTQKFEQLIKKNESDLKRDAEAPMGRGRTEELRKRFEDKWNLADR